MTHISERFTIEETPHSPVWPQELRFDGRHVAPLTGTQAEALRELLAAAAPATRNRPAKRADGCQFGGGPLNWACCPYDECDRAGRCVAAPEAGEPA